MKLASFTHNGTAGIGVVDGDQVIDLAQCGDFPTDMKALLARGLDGVAEAVRGKSGIPTSELSLEAPVPNPGKILALGLNYADHVAETGSKTPKYQIWFNKQHNCANGPYSPINLPSVSEKLDYEAELCVVIGKRCKHVPYDRAHEVIAGYFCGNDVSVRDWQIRVPTFQIGKSFDTHGPMGPYLVTPDEVGDPHELDIRCLVNGEERQNSNTKHLIFNCYAAVEHLTQAFTLDVGDVLFMGTPSGVAVAMDPPKWLVEGDVVRVEIDKLGHIENTVVAETAETVIG